MNRLLCLVAMVESCTLVELYMKQLTTIWQLRKRHVHDVVGKCVSVDFDL
jgi:hypothetical protein